MATTKSARREPTAALVDTEETFPPESAEDERFAHLQLPEDELRGDEDDEDDDAEDSEDAEEDEVQVENEQ